MFDALNCGCDAGGGTFNEARVLDALNCRGTTDPIVGRVAEGGNFNEAPFRGMVVVAVAGILSVTGVAFKVAAPAFRLFPPLVELRSDTSVVKSH